MKLIKYFLIATLIAFNGFNFNFNSSTKKISEEYIITRTWSNNSNTGWMNFDFNESNFIKPNKIIKSVKWQAGINAEYYGWSYSDWQSSTTKDNNWFRERSTSGQDKYPFKLRVLRDWWSCGNSALMLEVEINNHWQRLFKFQKIFGYCWKFDYSKGFKLKVKFEYEDQYQEQLDNFENNINKKINISTPTTDLDEIWMDQSGPTNLKKFIESDLINKNIKPAFDKSKKNYKNNNIFKSIQDFRRNIKIKKNGPNDVVATFQVKYVYGNFTYNKDITVRYKLKIDPNADYYQNQLNNLFKNIKNNFNIKVANLSGDGSWEIGKTKTNINNEIEKHLNAEIRTQIKKLEQKNINIFEFDKLVLSKKYKRLNNKQVELMLTNIKYKLKNPKKEYSVLNPIKIIYNLDLDLGYLKDNADSRIKFFINNEEQGRKNIKIRNNDEMKDFLAFNEKVNLEFYPEALPNARESILEQIEIKSNNGKVVKIEEILVSDNPKYPRIFRAVLDEPIQEIDKDGNIKDEVIYYNITIKRHDVDSNGDILESSTEVYKKSVLIKETNPAIQFTYTTDISSGANGEKEKPVTSILPETVVYNEQLDKEIPESFSLETKNILLDNEKVNSIFSNISSWMISTKSTKPVIKKKEIPYIKKITETNDKNINNEYDFSTSAGEKKWNDAGKAWTGIVNGYLEFRLETVFSNLSPKYTLYQFDQEIGNLLDQIPKLKDKISKETDNNKKNQYEEELKKLDHELHNKMISLLKDRKNITSFWDSNLAKLIMKHYKPVSKEYFLNFTLQQTKDLINKFLEWIRNLIFPFEKDPLDDVEIKDMSDQEKADYLARRIIETFKNRSLTFSAKINDEISFNESFSERIKKQIISWMNKNEKAKTILKDSKTSLKLRVFDANKTQLRKMKITKINVHTILEVKVNYGTANSPFIPSIDLIFRVGKPDDDINPDDKTNDDKNGGDDGEDNKVVIDEVIVDDNKIGSGKMSKTNLGIIIGSILGSGAIIISVTVVFYIRKIKKIN